MKSLILSTLLLATSVFAAASSPLRNPLHNEPPQRLTDMRTRHSELKKTALKKLIKSGNPAGLYPVNLVDSFPFNVTAAGGATLNADATFPTPDPSNPNEVFPLVIFPNSWGTPEIEYILKIINITTGGYVCVEYETRGWYDSTGFIDTAGPADRSDGSELIDLVINQYAEAWHVNTSSIAFAGISYGAGISLMMAGYDTRVKTAVSLSGWGNLTTSMYHNESPSLNSLNVLVDSAQAVGNPSPDLIRLRQNLIAHVNMTEVIAYGNDRSPINYLSQYNLRGTPIFMSNNYLDRFFDPQGNCLFWDSIGVQNKMLILNNGPHAIPSAIGLADLSDYIWSKGQMWMDAILKGIDNGILAEPRVQMQKGNSIFSFEYNMYDNVPQPYYTMSMTPRGSGNVGGLRATAPLVIPEKNKAIKKRVSDASEITPNIPPAMVKALSKLTSEDTTLMSSVQRDKAIMKAVASMGLNDARKDKKPSSFHAVRKEKEPAPLGICTPTAAPQMGGTPAPYYNDTITFSTNQSLTLGSDIWRSLGVPFNTDLSTVDSSNALVFISDPLTTQLDLCGFPLLQQITVLPINTVTGQNSPSYQFYVYLYDVDESCSGTLLSDGLFTRWYDDSDPSINPYTGTYTLDCLEMRMICTTIPAGHRLGLGVELYSKDFTPSETNLQATFVYETAPSLVLPIS